MFELAAMIFKFLGGDVAKALVDAYKIKRTSETTDAKIAADLAAGEIAAQTTEIKEREATKRAEIGHPFEVEKLFAYVTFVYYSKILIWDKVLGLGSTDPLGGWALWAANLVISFYFAKRGFENVARIIRK